MFTLLFLILLVVVFCVITHMTLYVAGGILGILIVIIATIIKRRKR